MKIGSSRKMFLNVEARTQKPEAVSRIREMGIFQNIGITYYPAATQARRHQQQPQQQQQQTEGDSDVADELVCFLEFQLLGAEPLAEGLIPGSEISLYLVHLHLQQPGGENRVSPGRHRPARRKNPNPTSFIAGWLGFGRRRVRRELPF